MGPTLVWESWENYILVDPKMYLKQDGDGDGAAVMLDGVLVGVEPGVIVVELGLHVELDVVDGVLRGGPVQVDVRQGVTTALKVCNSKTS